MTIIAVGCIYTFQIECISGSADFHPGNQLIYDHTKLLKKIVPKFFDPELLAEYTWTGKTKEGKKLKFEKKERIVKLLYGISKRINSNYPYSSFKWNLVNKVLKYAYEGKKEKKMKPSSKAGESSHFGSNLKKGANVYDSFENLGEGAPSNNCAQVQMDPESTTDYIFNKRYVLCDNYQIFK